jgi:hypothetical protein
MPRLSPVHAAATGGLQATWNELGLDQKQAIATASLASITVRRAIRRGPIFNPGRLDFQWKVYAPTVELLRVGGGTCTFHLHPIVIERGWEELRRPA